MSKKINWDEGNIAANDADSLAANRQKILEPKTPFHYLEEDGEPAAYPPKAAAAVAGPRPTEAASSSPPSYQEKQLMPGMHDLAALSAKALERRVDAAETPVQRPLLACPIGDVNRTDRACPAPGRSKTQRPRKRVRRRSRREPASVAVRTPEPSARHARREAAKI
jgi:hypothetical protein